MGYWAFDDPHQQISEETTAPPGFKQMRAIPKDAVFGKMYACRQCGAVVAATTAAIDDHRTFHEHLAADVANFYRMRYSADNPNYLLVFPGTSSVSISANSVSPALVHPLTTALPDTASVVASSPDGVGPGTVDNPD
jgi:hypothetical protein